MKDFKVGDIIRVKHREEFAKEFGEGDLSIRSWVGIANGFNELMDIFLGEQGRIIELTEHPQGKVYIKFCDSSLQEDAKRWVFSKSMIIYINSNNNKEIVKYFTPFISKKLKDVL